MCFSTARLKALFLLPFISPCISAWSADGNHWFSAKGNDQKRAALRAQFNAMVAAGYKELYHVDNSQDVLFAKDALINPTVPSTFAHKHT